MQRTVGPCHRDRKQKRNEKSEEKRDTTAGGRGRKGSHRAGQRVPPGDISGWAARTGGHKEADAAGGGRWHGRGRALGFGER